MDLPLTRAERDRFAAWLEQECEQSELLAEQAENMKGGRDDLPGGNPADKMWDTVAKRERNWALACKVVASKLRSIEEMTVEG